APPSPGRPASPAACIARYSCLTRRLPLDSLPVPRVWSLRVRPTGTYLDSDAAILGPDIGIVRPFWAIAGQAGRAFDLLDSDRTGEGELVTTPTTVFSRVTVVAPQSRIDVALPAGVALGHLPPI